jgi:hypothetical protein
MTDTEIYYPLMDNNKKLEYSRFNYKTKEVKHKYAIEMMHIYLLITLNMT